MRYVSRIVHFINNHVRDINIHAMNIIFDHASICSPRQNIFQYHLNQRFCV